MSSLSAADGFARRPGDGEQPRLMSAPGESVLITDACTACGACLATCPEHALRRAPKRPAVDDAACTACWACIEICPAGAILEVP